MNPFAPRAEASNGMSSQPATHSPASAEPGLPSRTEAPRQNHENNKSSETVFGVFKIISNHIVRVTIRVDGVDYSKEFTPAQPIECALGCPSGQLVSTNSSVFVKKVNGIKYYVDYQVDWLKSRYGYPISSTETRVFGIRYQRD